MPACTFEVSGDDELIVPVIIENPDTRETSRVNAAIDTGAAYTQIENEIAEKLKLPFHDSMLINSINATIRCNMYVAKIAFEFEDGVPCELGEFYIVDELNTTVQCIIARDILYRGLLIYNGINSYFTLSF